MSIVFTPGVDGAAGTWHGPNNGENPRWAHVYCPQCQARSCVFMAPAVAQISGDTALLTGGWTCPDCSHHDDDASITGL